MALSSVWIRTETGYVRADQVVDVLVRLVSDPYGRARTDPAQYFVEISLPVSVGNPDDGFTTCSYRVTGGLDHSHAVEVADQLVADLIEVAGDSNIAVLAFTGRNIEHFRTPGHYRSEHPAG